MIQMKEKISGIQVRLIEKSSGKIIAQTTTNENGEYKFDGHEHQ